VFRLPEVCPKTASWRHRLSEPGGVHSRHLYPGGVRQLFTDGCRCAPTSAAFKFSPSSPIVGSPVLFDASSSVCFRLAMLYRWTDDADRSLESRHSPFNRKDPNL